MIEIYFYDEELFLVTVLLKGEYQFTSQYEQQLMGLANAMVVKGLYVCENCGTLFCGVDNSHKYGQVF